MARRRGGNVSGSLVLDAQGIVKLAGGDPRATYPLEAIRSRRGRVVVAASTLTEVLRGGSRDAPIYRVLNKLTIVPIDQARARAAGELLGQAGLSAHRCGLDALVALVALEQPRPVVLLTSDVKDLARLTEEPGRAARERVAVVLV